MKKFIYKTFITLSFICFFQVKTPIFHITQPSLMHHFDFIAPYNDIPIDKDKTAYLISFSNFSL